MKTLAISTDSDQDLSSLRHDYPDIRFLSDGDAKLVRELGLADEGGAPSGATIAYPTLILSDRAGIVRWLYRAERNTDRAPWSTIKEAIEALAGGT